MEIDQVAVPGGDLGDGVIDPAKAVAGQARVDTQEVAGVVVRGSDRRHSPGARAGLVAMTQIARAPAQKASRPGPRSITSPAKRSFPPMVTRAIAGFKTFRPTTWRRRSATRAPSTARCSRRNAPRAESSRPRKSGKSRSSFLIKSAPGVIPCGL